MPRTHTSSRHGFSWMIGLLVLTLAGCGGGGGDSSSSISASSSSSAASSASSSASSVASYTIGGTISGLVGTVVLQNNGGNNLSRNTNGAFAFATALPSGATYAATLLSQPVNQGCSINNGSGTVASANITTIQVNCATLVITSNGATLNTGRAGHRATRLTDGKVLITGGFAVGVFPSPALDTAELYDPATGVFTVLANRMQLARTSHTATLLPDGKVLIAGGQYNNDDDGHNTAELYDPATQSFTALSATMASPRGAHGAVLLNSGSNSGKVLLVGGYYGPSSVLSDAELYDPVAKTFTAISAHMVTLRNEHSTTLLPNGKVLIAGGTDENDVELNNAELFDPSTQTFTAVSATMTTPRGGHAATLLPSGRVLLVGGASVFDNNNPAAIMILDSAELFDPATQTFTALSTTLPLPRLMTSATTLANGTVLIVGGARIVSGPAIQVFNSTAIYGP